MKKIAIVDDDIMFLNMYATKLRHEGFEVETYNSGKEALARIPMDKPDMVFLDIVMPDVDGIDILEALKQSEVTRMIPVVLLTNLDGTEIRHRGAEHGALYFVNKADYLPSQIVSMAKEVLE